MRVIIRVPTADARVMSVQVDAYGTAKTLHEIIKAKISECIEKDVGFEVVYSVYENARSE